MVLTLGTLISTATAFNCSYLVHNLTTTAGATAGFPNLTHIARATKAAQKASPTTAAVFATSTAIKPNPVASGTTKKCGKYYQVQSVNLRYLNLQGNYSNRLSFQGDFCQVIALKQKIDLELFEAINPQINKDCTNLFLGYYYCVSPTADWNSAATTNPKIVTAPTITPKGTTDKCYEYVNHYPLPPSEELKPSSAPRILTSSLQVLCCKIRRLLRQG